TNRALLPLKEKQRLRRRLSRRICTARSVCPVPTVTEPRRILGACLRLKTAPLVMPRIRARLGVVSAGAAFFAGSPGFGVPVPQVPSSPAWMHTDTAFERTELGALAFSASEPACERTSETLPAALVVPLPGTCVTVPPARVPIVAPAIGSPVWPS